MKKRQKEKDQTAKLKSFGNKSKHIIHQNSQNCNYEEIWKDLKGFNNNYQISNLGRVRRVQIIVPSVSKLGYKQIHLEGRYYYIHRLVASYFLEKIDGKNEVNHLDGNPSNNKFNNLEWCTHQENIQYSFDKLDRKVYGKKGFDNPCSKAVGQFDLEGNLIKIWGSQMEIERTLGIRHSNISMACSGKNIGNRSHGYIWKWLV